MSYYISYSGNITFKPETNMEKVVEQFHKTLDEFEDASFGFDDNKIDLYCYDGHGADEFELLLADTANETESGLIECDGEDHEFWKFEFVDGKWFYYEGEKSYKEKPDYELEHYGEE